MNRITFEGFDYAPVADFGLMRAAVEAAEVTQRDAATHVGLLFSADMSFYASRPELMMRMVDYGVLAVEMGANATDLKMSIHPHPTLSETLMESAEVFFGHATHVYRPKRG